MAQKVEDLDTWKLCNELVERVQVATETGRGATDREFCEQINDAAADALSDVAEGFARFYPKVHATFLGYAIASLEEVRTRLAIGYKRKYFGEQTTSDLLNLCYRAERAAKELRAYLWSVKKEDLPPPPIRPAAARKRKRQPREGTS